ncbi:hypothetical protein C3K47_06030 [Solitalea longa]|uniref:Phage holin family protein n=1 Tax=Solitalea longa TaxID=2079460 RepID=A0A2S5A4T5_9SPHI|nr:hypothetical protein [Solitalea longa]POY37322.1 hypothetical protein C3K47_06030 [Solitalea longa]
MKTDEDFRLELLVEQFKEKIDLKLKYLTLQIVENVSKTLANSITRGILLGGLITVILFCSVALAFYLGNLLQQLWCGFLIVAGLYLLITIVFFFIKEAVLERRLVNFFIKIMLKNKDHEHPEQNNIVK